MIFPELPGLGPPVAHLTVVKCLTRLIFRGLRPLDPTPISDLHASVTNKVSKYAHLTLINA